MWGTRALSCLTVAGTAVHWQTEAATVISRALPCTAKQQFTLFEVSKFIDGALQRRNLWLALEFCTASVFNTKLVLGQLILAHPRDHEVVVAKLSVMCKNKLKTETFRTKELYPQ